MKKSEKYSYLDWLNGSICLVYATTLISKKTKRKLPTPVTWDEIEQDAIIEIKEKQLEIFNAGVTKLLDNWQSNFLKRSKNSKEPTILLYGEIQKFSTIVYGPMPVSNDKFLSYFEIFFTIESLFAIKNYIHETKINGISILPDFIHSPKCKNQNLNLIPDQIYAECCWQYFKWLELQERDFSPKNPPEEKNNITDTSNNNSGIENHEIMENPYPLVFTSTPAFNLFLGLRELTVKEKSIKADYGFIFNRMKQTSPIAIFEDLSHKNFINFLNENNYAVIKSYKLPVKNPANKQKVLQSLIEKYKADISASSTK